jgi:hypothetical protein
MPNFQFSILRTTIFLKFIKLYSEQRYNNVLFIYVLRIKSILIQNEYFDIRVTTRQILNYCILM